MKLTDREKHILQAIASFLICAALVTGAIVHERIARLEYEAEFWEGRCEDWRESAWYWRDAYHDLLFDREYQRQTEAELILLEASEPEPVEATWVNVGGCRITFYCPCEKCCGKWANGITATGMTAAEGRTVAVDPNVIPLGSEVLIGDHIYIAEDTGVSGNAVDIFLTDHDRCLQLGTYTTDVSWRVADTINT